MIATLAGENDVLRQDTLRQIVADFVAEHGEWAVERLDGEETEYNYMLGAVQSLPFLVTRKLVVLRAPSANKDFTEKFSEFVADIAETNDVVLVEPKLDKRTAYYKALKKLTDFREFAVLDANGLGRYLVDYAKRRGGNLRSNDAQTLINRTGTNQLMLQHDLDTLLDYSREVTRESIELLTVRTPQSTIFELLEAAFGGNAKRALQLYQEQRALKEEPQKILALIIWQLYILALIKMGQGRSADQIASEAKLNPYVVRKSQNLVRHMSLAELKAHIRVLREFDVRLKRETLNADEVVQYYLITLAQ